jgi:nicotinamide phosphoribosyltransferase
MRNPTLPVLLKDGYKVGHVFQYPDGTELVFSNLTPRSSRIEGVDEVILFGLQYFIEEYLISDFNENFFHQPQAEVMKRYQRRIDNYLGPGVTSDHISDLWELGYLPLRIDAVPEGTGVPLRVPMLTIQNTKPEFFWLTNMLETILCNVLWMPCTSATIAKEYYKTFRHWEKLTIGQVPIGESFVPWQGHDFSMRGMSGLEAALTSGAGHLLSFTGTDTIPAIDFLEVYYGANSDLELVGGSVPATEHSVMCMDGKDGEEETFLRLMNIYPGGILSVVSDTWDFWHVMVDILPAIKEKILSRDGKLVIRPDSGDPVKIICGDRDAHPDSPAYKGAVEILWDIFGGTETVRGYKTLDDHVGLIYGDSINQERQKQILSGLADKGFSSYNVVLGIGSYNYQFNTRDTFGFAMKATAGIVNGERREIYKSPKTDDGTKNSARGLLKVIEQYGKLHLRDGLSADEYEGRIDDVLQTVFLNGDLLVTQTLAEIRERVRGTY